jgi:hypothetical protein
MPLRDSEETLHARAATRRTMAAHVTAGYAELSSFFSHVPALVRRAHAQKFRRHARDLGRRYPFANCAV